MSRLAAIISAIVICLVVCLGWLAMHYRNAATEQKTRADGAEQQVNAAQAITSNVLTTMTIFNTIAEANQHAKSRSHWTHREPRLISGLLLRMMIALIALCLLAQLSGCSNTRTVYVKVPVVPLPASLTADTPQPEIPDNLTWGQSLDLNVSLLSALGQCNRDKADIRQAEKKRASQ